MIIYIRIWWSLLKNHAKVVLPQLWLLRSSADLDLAKQHLLLELFLHQLSLTTNFHLNVAQLLVLATVFLSRKLRFLLLDTYFVFNLTSFNIRLAFRQHSFWLHTRLLSIFHCCIVLFLTRFSRFSLWFWPFLAVWYRLTAHTSTHCFRLSSFF